VARIDASTGFQRVSDGKIGACAKSLGQDRGGERRHEFMSGAARNRLGTGVGGERSFRGNIRCRGAAKFMGMDTVTAWRLAGATDAEGFPLDASWETAPPIRFRWDWQGRNADADRETEVRLLWAPEILYLRFDARYRNITVFPGGDSGGRRDQLWDRDVCEAFLQPNPLEPRRYIELEVAPNGFWIDLDIAAGEKQDLRSGLRRRVGIDETKKRWRAVLAVPMNSLVERFDASVVWRANFYRVEGPTEPRFYSAWQPTHTAQPNFHVPEAFGELVFA
jgi:Carbohydrate-binding family 9